MKILTFETYKEMSAYAADIFSAQMKAKPNSVLGLATGSTPIGLYEILCERYKNNEISFKEATTFNLDEYCNLPPENDQSYRYFMNDNLFKYTDFKKENINFPISSGEGFAEICDQYDEKIKKAGGIDIQLLGIGLNGHVGFNEPDEYFTKETHVVNLTENTIEANSRFFEKIEDVPTSAVTMGMYSIMTAKKIVMVINGEKKKEIFEAATTGKITPHVPASLLQLHPDTIVLYSKE